MLRLDGINLSQRERGSLLRALLTDSYKPVLEGDTDDIKLAYYKLWDIARSGGASEGSWPVAQHAECTGAHLKP